MNESNHVDRLLSGFFRSEMPAKWPAAPEVPTAEYPMPSSVLHARSSLTRSRSALLASIAVVLLGGWLLAGKSAGPLPKAGSFEGSTATRPSDLRLPK
jgi:hypothetical protein